MHYRAGGGGKSLGAEARAAGGKVSIYVKGPILVHVLAIG
jgi:hypothetical protein